MAFLNNKPMTEEEYKDRLRRVHEAYKIFKNLTDNNMTESFRAYIEVFEERQYPLNVRSGMFRKDVPSNVALRRTPFDNLERPHCPECGTHLYIRPLPPNKENVKTQLVCGNEKCDVVLDSTYDVRWWIDHLPKINKTIKDGGSENER